jgi:uncharacterized protein
MIFEWDEAKDRNNFKKHKIIFDEAKTIFNDPFSLTFPDLEHSKKEYRFVSIGMSKKDRILVVIHTEREERIRIISSRRATAKERRAYEKREY